LKFKKQLASQNEHLGETLTLGLGKREMARPLQTQKTPPGTIYLYCSRYAPLSLVLFSLTGCASLVFSDGHRPDGVNYWDPQPFLQITCDDKGNQLMAFAVGPNPNAPRSVRPRSGWGSANLNASFANGLVSQFGQQTDTKIPETITALSGLATAAAGLKAAAPQGAAPPPTCRPALYQVSSGPNGTMTLTAIAIP
jgi:hypothetical protein